MPEEQTTYQSLKDAMNEIYNSPGINPQFKKSLGNFITFVDSHPANAALAKQVVNNIKPEDLKDIGELVQTGVGVWRDVAVTQATNDLNSNLHRYLTRQEMTLG